MSLNWSLKNIENQDNLCWIDCPDDFEPGMFDSVFVDTDGQKKRLNYVTSTLIWATMIIGVSEITKKNVDHFFFRLHAWEKINGSFLLDKNGNQNYIKYDDVKQHIGLSTNASTMSNLKFFAKLRELVFEKRDEI